MKLVRKKSRKARIIGITFAILVLTLCAGVFAYQILLLGKDTAQAVREESWEERGDMKAIQAFLQELEGVMPENQPELVPLQTEARRVYLDWQAQQLLEAQKQE